MAVTIAYGALLGGFTRERGAIKAEFNAFCEGTVADLAKLVLARYAANAAVGAGAASHFWAFFAGDSTYTDFQDRKSVV